MMWLIYVSLFATSMCPFQERDLFERKRHAMVADQIVARGIKDTLTIKSMKKVPRHLFVPTGMQRYAYDDNPLEIGYNQTISQPYIVAWMTELSKPEKGKRALEIGTGSGYQAVVLAEIVSKVYTIEIVPELARSSKTLLQELGYTNIETRMGNGYVGWEEEAPFDIIIVTAACDHVPSPLTDQLAENGRLIMPLGDPESIQELILIVKKNGKLTRQTLSLVRFVPLIIK